MEDALGVLLLSLVDHVLDLDLDFFVWPISRNPTDCCRLPEKDLEYLSSHGKFAGFWRNAVTSMLATAFPGNNLLSTKRLSGCGVAGYAREP